MQRFVSFFLFASFTSTLLAQFTQVGPRLDGNAPNDNFGFSVAMDTLGKTIAVGAPLYDNDFGQVRVYTEFQGVWTQLGQDLNGTEIGQQFGFSTALSANGRILALGGLSGSMSSPGGHARVYEYTGGQWTLLGSPILGAASSDQFGSSIDLSADGRRMVVGAREESTAGADAGQASVFEWINNTWSLVGSPINGEAAGDECGTAVAISADGNRILVGSPGWDGTGSDQGQIRAYNWDGSMWVLIGTSIDGQTAGESFGGSLDISADGETIVGAASLHDHGAGFGSVRAYSFVGLDWVQKGTDIRGNSDFEAFGQSVRVNKKGQDIVIGTQSADDIGLSSGRVNVVTFDVNSGDWVEKYSPITGTASFDNLGKSVAMNAAGNRFIVGANLAGATAGYTEIYQDSIMPVGIKTAFANHQLQVFSREQSVHIISAIPFQQLEIQVLDLTGRTIIQKKGLIYQEQHLLLPEEQGVYLIRLIDGKNQFTQKIISSR